MFHSSSVQCIAFVLLIFATREVCAEDAGTNSALEEIVITAQKRSENLQSVPLSVTAVSAEQLSSSGVTSVIGLQQTVPSLVVNDFAGFILPFIRGIGTSIQGTGFYSSVATYVDGVYYSRLSSSSFDYDNVEQVQVLMGPQGALYGRNADGGALVYTTRTPEPGEALGGRVSVQTGTYATRSISGSLWSGLGDKWAVEVSGKRVIRDGFVKNLGGATHSDGFDNEDLTAGSGKLVFRPIDSLNFVLAGSYSEHDDRAGTGWLQVSQRNAAGLNGAQQLYAGIAESLGITNVAGVANQIYSNRIGQTYDDLTNGFENGVLRGPHLNGTFAYTRDETFSFQATKNFSSFDIKSITALTRSVFNSASDVLGIAPHSSGIAGLDGTVGFTQQTGSNVFTEELQALSTSGPFDWVGGLSYFRERGTDAVSGDALGFSSLSDDTSFKTVSKAAYGQAKLPLYERFDLTLGGRYTTEDYSLADHTPGPGNVGALDQSSNKFTESVILDYKMLDDFMVYANFGTGFKSGTLNTANPSAGAARPETVTSVELGFKSELQDRRLRLNGAVFHYDISDVQLEVINEGTAAAFFVNGPKSKVWGGEIEATERATQQLTLHAAATVLDPKYSRDTPLIIDGVQEGVLHTSGKLLVGASKFAVSADANFESTFGRSELGETLGAHYKSGYYFDPQNVVGTSGAGAGNFTVVDAEAYWKWKEHFKLSAALNNALDRKYFRAGVVAAGILAVAEPGEPRYFTVTATYNF